MKKISIIIISYNRVEDTLALLHDIKRLNNTDTLLQDVVLVNNASTVDYTAIKTFSTTTSTINIRYIESPENLGVARGRNFAIQFAKGDILAFFDDDVVIDDRDILIKIIHSFDKSSNEREMGAVSFKVLYDSTGEIQANAFPHKNFATYKDKSFFLTSYFVGCAHAIKQTAWQQAGAYPEDFFYGMEEYDLSYRLLNKGYAISYNSSVVIRHKESPLGRKPKSEKLRMMWVNKSKVAWKYLPLLYFISTVIMWSGEYLIKTGFSLRNFLKGCKAIAAIPFTEKRTGLKRNTMHYLRLVKARLWY